MSTDHTKLMGLTERRDAASLAIAYSSYTRACIEDDLDGRLVWGEMLAAAQDRTGIVLISRSLIDRGLVADQRERRRRAAA